MFHIIVKKKFLTLNKLYYILMFTTSAFYESHGKRFLTSTKNKFSSKEIYQKNLDLRPFRGTQLIRQHTC